MKGVLDQEMNEKMTIETRTKIFNEVNEHLLDDERPSEYFQRIRETADFKSYPFSLLYELKHTEQSPQHHPEGNVWNHTMLVVDRAAQVKNKSKDPAVLMWAALLHDIGKPVTTKWRKGKITAYNHDKEGAELAREFLSIFVDEEEFIDKVVKLVRYHMQILFVVKSAPGTEVDAMLQETDVDEIALLGLCDRLGRTNIDVVKEEENVREFLRIVKAVGK